MDHSVYSVCSVPPKRATLCLRNRQRVRRLDMPLLRRIAETLIRDLINLDCFDLGIVLVDAARIARLNETFLHHAGPTDVITFEYGQEPAPPADGSTPGSAAGVGAGSELEGGHACPLNAAAQGAVGTRADCPPGLHAEIFVCVEEAAVQARRFGTTWQSELVRYMVHGILHLRGFDDCSPGPRRRMKRAEDRYLRQLARRFELDRLG